MSQKEAVPPVVVYDCMVFLQGAARTTGPAAACLELVEQSRVTLVLSPVILAEIQDVLTRPKLRQKYPILTPDYVTRLLQTLLNQATLFPEVPLTYRYARDPKDEPYLNLALVAQASYLVSRDRDLLDLMTEEARPGHLFRQQFPALRILEPVAFLQQIASLPASPVE